MGRPPIKLRRSKDAIKITIWEEEIRNFKEWAKVNSHTILKITSIEDVRIIELKPRRKTK